MIRGRVYCLIVQAFDRLEFIRRVCEELYFLPCRNRACDMQPQPPPSRNSPPTLITRQHPAQPAPKQGGGALLLHIHGTGPANCTWVSELCAHAIKDFKWLLWLLCMYANVQSFKIFCVCCITMSYAPARTTCRKRYKQYTSVLYVVY
jgi:hypothetical protein